MYQDEIIMKKINIDYKRFEKPAKISGIVLACLVCLYVLLDVLIMPLYTRQRQAIEVPDVTFLTFTASAKLLKKAGLKPVEGGVKFDELYPPGFVLFQNPEAGSKVKKGRRVYLIVGKGPRIFPMPKLVGMPIRDANFTLRDLKLVLGQVRYDIDDYYPEGVVSWQSIDPEQEVAVNESVDLVVSLGATPTQFIVPGLIGKSFEAARMEIRKAGLTLGKIEEQQTDKLIPNTVVSQSLEEGLEVLKGDTLNIVVSKLPGTKKEESSIW